MQTITVLCKVGAEKETVIESSLLSLNADSGTKTILLHTYFLVFTVVNAASVGLLTVKYVALCIKVYMVA